VHDTELGRRVAEWQENIQPRLNEEVGNMQPVYVWREIADVTDCVDYSLYEVDGVIEAVETVGKTWNISC